MKDFPPESKGLLAGSQKPHPWTSDPPFLDLFSCLCSNGLEVNITERIQESKKTFPYLQWQWHKLYKITIPGSPRIGAHTSSAFPVAEVFVGALLEEAHSIWLAVVSSNPYEASVSVAVLVPPEPYGLTTNDHHLQKCGHQGIMALCQTWGRGSPQQCWRPPWYPLWTREKNSCCSQKHLRFSHLFLLGVTSETPQTHGIQSQIRTRKPCSLS